MRFKLGKSPIPVALLAAIAAAFAIGWAAYSQSEKAREASEAYAPPSPYSSGAGAYGRGGGSSASGSSGGGSFACNEPCHSSNKAIVNMHDAVKSENCLNCHSQGENLMSGGGAKKSTQELAERKVSDPNCSRCHGADAAKKPSGASAGARVTARAKKVGGLFCPKCGTSVDPQRGSCGKCGGKIVKDRNGWRCTACGSLVDVDEIARISKEKPSNEVCLKCHPKDDELKHKHVQVRAVEGDGWKNQISNCLSCHTSHKDCGGCHFGSGKK